MATVRLNDGIRATVINNLKNLFTPKLDAKAKELRSISLGDAIQKAYVSAEDLVHVKALPDAWFHEINELDVSVKGTFPDGVTFSTSFRSPVSGVRLPIDYCSRYYNYASVELKPGIEGYEQVYKILQQIHEIEQERHKLVNGMSAILNKCSTLRQVLELWPTALDFMPSDVVKRHAEKTEKRTSVAEEIEVDDALKLSLAKARMMSGGA